MLFFDFDGTIIDTNTIWTQVDEAFLNRRGLLNTPEYQAYIIHCVFDTAATYTKAHYALEESEEEIKGEWVELAMDRYARAELKPGAEAYLRKCQKEGRRMGIITSCVRELVETALQRHGLGDMFEFVVYANDLGVEKRHPEAFIHAANLAGVDPGVCVMFDDSPKAALGAKAAGMQVVGVYDPIFAHARESMTALCDRYILSFEELL